MIALRWPDWQRWLRHAKPVHGRIRLGMRQVYILPTFRGWLFGALLVALLIAAINYSNNLIFALTFVLAGIANAALLQTWRNLAGLEMEVRDAEPVFAGQIAQFPVTLRNARPVVRDALRLKFANGAEVLTYVDTKTLATTQVPCPALTRGTLRPGRLTINTRYPLGLFRAWSPVNSEAVGLVYPAPVEGVPLPAPSSSQELGGAQGRDGDDDFAGLRSYRTGDPLHRVSWKTSARTEDLYAKEFSAEAASVRWLDWDQAPAGDQETRLGILAAWVLNASTDGSSWGLRIPGATVNPDTGIRHRDRCLDELARYGE